MNWRIVSIWLMQWQKWSNNPYTVKMEKDTKKHYLLYTDYRMQSLEIVLEGLDHSSKTLSDKVLNSIGFLDPSDTEFYLAIRFMAIQNYIRYTIQDFKEIYQLGNIKPHKYNYVMDKIPGHNFNMIQLDRKSVV